MAGRRLYGRKAAQDSYSMVKGASVVRPVPPLMGRISCGQAEKAITRSISAPSTPELPGVATGSPQARVPSAVQGIFMNRLSGDGVAGTVMPRAARAAGRVSRQVAW